MHELQSLLLKKIPRLGELTFGCEVGNGYRSTDNPYHRATFIKYLKGTKHVQTRCIAFGEEHFAEWGFSDKNDEDNKFIIYGHKPGHSDLLEALGEDWAMTGGYQLLYTHGGYPLPFNPKDDDKPYPKLPRDLSDFSLPEYEETRKQIIQLLTK